MCPYLRLRQLMIITRNLYIILYLGLFAERILQDEDRPLEILQEWGPQKDEVKFVLRYTVLQKPNHFGKLITL